MATQPTAEGLWLEHKLFDIRSALDKGPDIGFGSVPCQGTLYIDRQAFDEGDLWVIVECDHCDYAAGVRRVVIAEHMDDVIADGERELRWWQR